MQHCCMSRVLVVVCAWTRLVHVQRLGWEKEKGDAKREFVWLFVCDLIFETKEIG